MKSTFLFLIALLCLGSSSVLASFDSSPLSKFQEQSKIQNSKEHILNQNSHSIYSFQLGPDKRPRKLDEQASGIGMEPIAPCSGPSPGNHYCSCYFISGPYGQAPMSKFCASAIGSSFCDKTINCYGG